VLLLAIGVALAAYFTTRGGGTRRHLAWQDLTAQVPSAEWAQPTISVARDPTKLTKVFARATYGRHPKPPHIDFAHREAVLVAAGPRSSTGYSLHVDRVTQHGDSIDVVVRERTPSLRDHVTARLTYPILLITLPKSGKHVHVRYAGRS
jgi:protease stability complex PrcB-like protein